MLGSLGQPLDETCAMARERSLVGAERGQRAAPRRRLTPSRRRCSVDHSVADFH
jgi:hypothetical protein